jgi:hypothetical protein
MDTFMIEELVMQEPFVSLGQKYRAACLTRVEFLDRNPFWMGHDLAVHVG